MDDLFAQIIIRTIGNVINLLVPGLCILIAHYVGYTFTESMLVGLLLAVIDNSTINRIKDIA